MRGFQQACVSFGYLWSYCDSTFTAAHVQPCRRKLCCTATKMAAVFEALLPSASSREHIIAASFVASRFLRVASGLAEETSMARSDALELCCGCAALLLATGRACFPGPSSSEAAWLVEEQVKALNGLISLASGFQILLGFAVRLHPARLAAWLSAAADVFQGVQAQQQRRGVCELRASSLCMPGFKYFL